MFDRREDFAMVLTKLLLLTIASFLTMGTIAALREYAADARAAHSHLLFEMRPILSCSRMPDSIRFVFVRL